MKLTILTLLFMSIASLLPSQPKSIPILDKQTKTQAVNKISELLTEYYIFSDTAEKMVSMISTKLSNGEYDNISDPMAFAQILTKDLQSISRDKHLNMNFNPGLAKELLSAGGREENNDTRVKSYLEEMKNNNYGFRKIEILDGNIGYIDLRGFADPKEGAKTVESAMGLIANTNALIIDLRQNGGGDPAMVQLICSYFFNETPIHLNDLYYRKTNKTEEYWTLKEINGKRMIDMPLYILTSPRTFSGAEEFSYNMKNLKRAILIGETTGGGANPGEFFAVNDNMVIFVPNGRAINPITKTNWEGTGVTPDINVPQDKALTTAKIEIVKTLIAKGGSEEKMTLLRWQEESLQAELNPYTPDVSLLNEYAGDYGNRIVSVESGSLMYERKDMANGKRKLVPFAKDVFNIEGVSYVRFKFSRDSAGKITGIDAVYDNGMKERSERVN